MRKLLTILFLGTAILIGTPTSDAKTSKKKAKAKTSQNVSQSGSLLITDFLHKENNYGTYGFNFNSDSQIEAALKKAGFSLKSKNVVKGEIEDGCDGDTAPGKIVYFVYTKKGITVEWSSYAYDEAPNNYYKDGIVIYFNDSAAKNAFIKSMKSNGYRNEYGIYMDAGNMIHINVEGNKVRLYGNWA